MTHIFGTNYDPNNRSNIDGVARMNAFFSDTSRIINSYISDTYKSSAALRQSAMDYASSLFQTYESLSISGHDLFQFKDRYRERLVSAFIDAGLAHVGQNLARELDSLAVAHLRESNSQCP